VIRKLIDRKYAELKDKIEHCFDDNLRTAYRYIDGLSAYKWSVNQVQEVSNDIQLDVDQLEINKVLDKQIKEMQTEFDFDIQTAELDLIESKFVENPFYKIEKALLSFDFVQIKYQEIDNLQKQFVLGGSRILTPEHINTDFMLTIMPKKEGEIMKNLSLLY
jgi:hypothetical protein